MNEFIHYFGHIPPILWSKLNAKYMWNILTSKLAIIQFSSQYLFIFFKILTKNIALLIRLPFLKNNKISQFQIQFPSPLLLHLHSSLFPLHLTSSHLHKSDFKWKMGGGWLARNSDVLSRLSTRQPLFSLPSSLAKHLQFNVRLPPSWPAAFCLHPPPLQQFAMGIIEGGMAVVASPFPASFRHSHVTFHLPFILGHTSSGSIEVSEPINNGMAPIFPLSIPFPWHF